MTTRRLVMVGLAALALGAVLHVSVPIVMGRPRPLITVAWTTNLAPAGRAALEQRFGLRDGQPGHGTRWTYAAHDPSSSNVRALIQHPAVDEVIGVDRGAFRILRNTPLTERQGGWVSVPRVVSGAARRLAWLLMFVGGLVALTASTRTGREIAGALARHGLAAYRDPRRELRAATDSLTRWLAGRIPGATPQAAAAFRIVLGMALLAFFATEPVYPDLIRGNAVREAEGAYGAIVRWLSAHPAAVNAIGPFLTATGLLFVAGVWTRVTYAAFVAGALLWCCVYTLNTSNHAVAPLQLTLVALLAARWSDAWSVDAWVRSRLGRPLARCSAATYGFTFWLPTFVLGVTFAAAAWSKVKGGPAWIVNGTVMYHFVTDLDHAWVDWGVRLTRNYWIAVAFSGFAVLVEALVVIAPFTRRYGIRLLLGCASLLLLSGFVLFQGVVWFGWWILLLGFLPWHLVGRPPASQLAHPLGLARPLSLAAVVVVLGVAGQQIVASSLGIEARPMLSAYDMYSATYDSWADYEQATNLKYRVVAVSESGRVDLPGCVVSDRVAATAQRAMSGAEEERRTLRDAIGECVELRPDVSAVVLEGDRRVFDWEKSHYTWKRRVDVVGPIDVEWLRQ